MARILVTRASQQASALAEALRLRGCEPVIIPAIELAPPTSWCALDAALACLRSYDWLVFTSANAVEAFAERARQIGVALTLPQVAAIGAATALEVEERLGIGVALMPEAAVAESFAEALLPHALRADGAAAQFLLVRAEVARDHLPEVLEAAGAEVTIAAAYRTVVPAGSVEAVRQMFGARARWPDAITFTSGSTATNLLALMEAAGVELPLEVARVSIGPITSRTLQEMGWAADAEAAEATVEALAEAVVGVLKTDLSG